MSSTNHSTSTEFASIDQFEAARTGNLAWFHHHKAAGTLLNLNLCDADFGWFPLDLAARHGHLSVVRYLIEDSGQSVDATSDNNSAIRLAARHGHLSVVRYLIEESGQLVDATTDDNFAIRLAARYGHLPVVRYLIEESNQPIDVFADDTELLRTAAAKSSSVEIRVYLETVISIIESLGLDLAREFFSSQLSESTKNTPTSPMKGRI
jgi:ankyrin repeat protein